MRTAKLASLLIFLALLSSCAQVRYYPLCVFGPDPQIPTDKVLREKINAFVRGIVGKEARVEISVNERFVVVEAAERELNALSGVWPRAGCIGQTRYDVEYGQYKACIYLVEQGLKNGGMPPLGKWSDGLQGKTVYCGRSVGG